MNHRNDLKVLIIDNYDSYTFNLRQNFEAIDSVTVVVIRNNQFEWNDFKSNIMPYFHCIVISPGPGRPTEIDDFGICGNILLEATIPIFGVCLGHQGIASVYGGHVIKSNPPIHGRLSPVHHSCKGLFKSIPSPFNVVRYHSLIVSKEDLPADLEITAMTETMSDSLIMGLKHKTKPIWGVQFHPEVIVID